MIGLSLADVAAATGGSLVDVASAAAVVDGPVVVDSRAVEAGSLFVALPGANADGHDFAAAAVAAGARAVLGARRLGPGVPAVVVPDVLPALGRLARAVLDRRPGLPVVGVTGSSGKTSTKDLAAALLAPDGSTVAAVGSYNNEIGLPLTVLRLDVGTCHLVLEYSARGVGHIAQLCRYAPPTVAVVLNVGLAHLGEFGSRKAVARAKGELVEALPASGLAVLNADDPLVLGMRGRTAARVVTVGLGSIADVRGTDIGLDGQARASFTLVSAHGTAPVRLRLHGEHAVGNALAAAAVGLELGLDVTTVAGRLSEARPASRWRMEVTGTREGVTVVNDSYNANPESVRAALKALVAMSTGGRRSWAVLGHMAELGAAADTEHDAVGRLAVRLNVSRLVAVGPRAARMAAGAGLEGSWGDEAVAVPDAEAALALLRAELRPGDVVLVKGSRSAGLEHLAAALLEAVPVR